MQYIASFLQIFIIYSTYSNSKVILKRNLVCRLANFMKVDKINYFAPARTLRKQVMKELTIEINVK